MWMNEYDIENAVNIIDRYSDDDNLKALARRLDEYKDWINSNSDGWPYWTNGTKAANRAVEIITKAVDDIRRGGDAEGITDAIYKRALTPMKSRITRMGQDWTTVFTG